MVERKFVLVKALFEGSFHQANVRFPITATVTDLDGVLVEYMVQYVLFWEVFVYMFEEDSTSGHLYVYVIWGAVPYYAALSVPPVACRLFAVGEDVGVSTGFQGRFIEGFGFFKFSIVAG